MMDKINFDAPVRVLQVVTYMGRGGIESMLMNYYRHIDRKKIQFDFLVHRDFRAEFDDEIESLGGTIYRIPAMNPISPSYRSALRAFFRDHNYPIVHCHLNYMSGIVLAEAKRAGIPIRIAHSHTAATAADWKQWVRHIFKHSIPWTSTTLLACSSIAGKAVFGQHHFQIMPNAINAIAFRFDPSIRIEMRDQLGLGDCPVIMHIGRFDGPKNQRFLVDAFSILIKKVPNAKLLLVGHGPLREQVMQQADQLGLTDSIFFLGIRDDIPKLLQAADVFAFPSIFEGFGITLIEAQAAGLPCIKANTIPPECVVTDLVVSLPLESPSDWAEAILARCGSGRTDHMHDIISSGYDISAAAHRLENFYLHGESL